MMMKSSKGFTLMELMVVVAIIAVLGAISYPSYDSYMKKTRRTEAMEGLRLIAERQERYYLSNNTYTTSVTNLGLADPFVTESGYYSIAVDAAGAAALKSGWGATATAQGVQANDTTTNDGDCTTMTLDSTDLIAPKKCWR